MNLSKNNFKQALVALFLIGASSSNLFAQGAYFNVNAGYGLPLNGQTDILYNYSNSDVDGTSSSTDETVKLSFGKGLYLGGSFGYMFNKNIGAELGLNYLLGGKTKSEGSYFSEYYDNWTGEYVTYYSSYTDDLSSKMFQINPSLVLSSGFEKLNPYAKFGVIIGIGSITYNSESSNSDGINSQYQMVMNGGMAFGFSGSIGTQYVLNEKLSLFGELNLNSLAYAPTKGEVKEYKENGVDMLPSLSKSETNVEFMDSITSSYNNQGPANNPTQPSQQLATSFQYSSIGLKFGITLKL